MSERLRVTTVLVIRHAESEANAGSYFASQSDSPLSARGVAQADVLCRALGGTTIHAVYSSDLSRATRTVEAIARERGLVLVTSQKLRERHMGELTGLSFETARERYPELWARMTARDRHVVPPGGESHTVLSERVRAYLDEILPLHVGQTVVLGSHGVAIQHVLRHLGGTADATAETWHRVDNASVTRVDLTYDAGGNRSGRFVYINVRPDIGDTIVD